MSDDIFTSIGEAVGTIAATAAIASLFTPKQKAASNDISVQQALPACINLYGGYSRTAGAKMFEEVTGSTWAIILAVNNGRTDFGGFYCNGDRVYIDTDGRVLSAWRNGVEYTDGRYIDGRVFIYTRNGLPTETAYGEITSQFGSIWTSAHRGDNTGSIAIKNFAPLAKFQSQAFPNGPTEGGCIARGYCFDWRDVTQSRSDQSTWKVSDCPVVWLVHAEWTKWGTDWDFSIAPVLAALTVEADYCDELVAIQGGTQPRYTFGGSDTDEDPEGASRQKILDSMDGFYTFDGLGRLIVRAGRYYDPTVTITSDQIISWTWNSGVDPDNQVSEINVHFTDPNTDYNSNDTDAWPVSAYGKPLDLDLPWVTAWQQGRRLAKRKTYRVNPARTGTLVCDLTAMAAWAEQFIRVKNPDEPSMANVVCEISEAPELDFEAGTVTFQIISIDASIDAFNPATEEGAAPQILTNQVQDPLTTPEISSAVAVFDGTGSARIEIDALGPSRTDITWSGRWQVYGSSAGWTEWTDTSVSGGSVTLTTGTVPTDIAGGIVVEVEYTTAGGTPSGWSASYTVSTSTDAIAPEPVTGVAATASTTAGQINLTWRNPSSSNFDHAVVRYSTHSDMSSATTLPAVPGSPGQDYASAPYVVSGLTTGTPYYFTVTAANASGTTSTTPAPVSATAP